MQQSLASSESFSLTSCMLQTSICSFCASVWLLFKLMLL